MAPYGGAPKPYVHTLTPHVPADPSDLDLSNLRCIDAVKVARFTASDRYTRPVIQAGTYEIPPAEAERLSGQGFLVEGPDGTLRLTLTARLTLLAASHVRMDAGGRPVIRCSCGLVAHAKNAERADAVRLAHLAAVTARFVDSLDPAFTATVTAV
jgi:hypothetical protein